MTMQRARVGTTTAIMGEDWIAAGLDDAQEVFWEKLRAQWHRDLLDGGWWLDETPRETVEYDEEHGLVILHIRAAAKREVGNLFIAPADTPLEDQGWQAVGTLDSWYGVNFT